MHASSGSPPDVEHLSSSSSSLFNHIWYGRRIPESLRYEHGKPHTVSSLFNQPYMVRSSHSRKFTLRTRKAPHCSLFNHIWYGRRIPESLRYEHGKPHTVSSLFNGRRIPESLR